MKKSFWSRLGSWLRSTDKSADDPINRGIGWTPASGQPKPGIASRPATETATRMHKAAPWSLAETVRLGLDFGTSTILLSVKVGNRPPRVVQLDQGDAMPSYFWRDADGRDYFGSQAQAFPQAVHSVKLLLRNDTIPPEWPLQWGLKPSGVAFELIREALRRGLGRLQAERVLPATIGRLTLETNVGCSPMFSLQQRLLLRDICRELGLIVMLTNILEEPTAAAFEVALSGLLPGGRVMTIDIGGGTLDVCVLTFVPGQNQFRIFATGGADLGGDRYTNAVRDHLAAAVVERTGDRALSGADRNLLWQRAEDAKIRLTDQSQVRVALGGIADIVDGEMVLTREWFNKATGALVDRSVAAVTDVYRMARFSLDRGGELDPKPGGSIVELHPDGRSLSVSQLKLDGDGRRHLDNVFLVGGGGRLPALQERFRKIFGERLVDLELFGVDPVSPIVLGLGRHQSLDSVELQYPNWSIEATVSGQPEPIPLYEPFAPVYDFGWSETASFLSRSGLPATDGRRMLALQFKQVGKTGVRWPEVPLPSVACTLELRIDLFGNLMLRVNGRELYADHPAAPWKLPGSPDHPAWLPPKWKPPTPDSNAWFDLRNAGPG